MGYLRYACLIVRIRDELADDLTICANRPCSFNGVRRSVALAVDDDVTVKVNLVDVTIWTAACFFASGGSRFRRSIVADRRAAVCLRAPADRSKFPADSHGSANSRKGEADRCHCENCRPLGAVMW